MDITKKIIKALEKAGLNSYKLYTLTDGNTGIMVNHDYIGPYPTAEALKNHTTAGKIAIKYNCRYEARGYKSATLIII